MLETSLEVVDGSLGAAMRLLRHAGIVVIPRVLSDSLVQVLLY